MVVEVRPALSNEQIQERGKRDPEALARYLAARREELAEQEAEQRQAAQAASRQEDAVLAATTRRLRDVL